MSRESLTHTHTHTHPMSRESHTHTHTRRAEMRVLLLLLSLSSACVALGPAALTEATVYLKRYGYLSSSSGAHETEQMNEALRVFQKETELPVTGRLDGRTLAMMRAGRCGLRDGMMEYRVLGHWRKKRLTYRLYNRPPHLGWARTRAAVQAAFGYWSAVSPLHFQEVSGGHAEVSGGRADIKLSFHSRGQGCPVPFDGPGQVLGHAEGPESGTVHFDADEVWTEGRSYGANLRIVAAHEIGHALGLGHSQFHRALMGPVYTGYRDDFKLHQDDIRGIQSLYGRPVERPSAGKPSAPDPCGAPLDAIMLGPLHRTYALRGQHVWTRSESGYSAPARINALWKELPGNMNAAVHSQRTNKSYFLKGDKVWRYSGFKLDHGYPKRLRIPADTHAAFYLASRRALVFIKGSQYWLWDELGSGELLLQPRPLAQLITGLPSGPDAAFSSTDGRIHVFRGGQVWRVSPALAVEEGFPRRATERWVPCAHQ